MKQGSISVLVGIHSPIHSFMVLRSWKILYGRWPKLWQVVCIFLHDVGHWGKDYLDDKEQKKAHWVEGTVVAYTLFGMKGMRLVAGHTESSPFPKSQLQNPDKYSWYIAPYWWLWWNNLVEPKIKGRMKSRVAILDFQQKVKESIESGEFRSTHNMYLERIEEGYDLAPGAPKCDYLGFGAKPQSGFYDSYDD